MTTGLLADDEVEKYIVRISTGTKLDVIDDNIILFKYPDNNLKLKTDIFYDVYYKKAISDGLLSRKSLEKLITERKLFSEEEQKKLDSLNSKLEAQHVLLGKTTRVKANQDRIKKVIEELDYEILQLTYKKKSKLMMSAEVNANEERSLYLCWASTYNEETLELFWESYSDFSTTMEIEFREKILTSFLNFYSGISTSKIRHIARHNLWRIRYVNSQKVGEQLFGVPSADYTTDMLSLVYWSNYYDNIYQMMPEDRPGDLVIDDDYALDAYMKAYYEERTRDDATRRSKQKNPGKLSAFDSEEVVVTASNELWQDIDYDKPREAKKLKDRTDIKKRTKRG